MPETPLPADIHPESGCRLPLPDRDALDAAGRKTYDSLADPSGGSLAGLQGPGGIRLHSPAVSRGLRPVNLHLRDPDVLPARLRELAILVTAREHDCEFEWHAHEAEAVREGVAADVIEAVRLRGSTAALDPADAAIIEFGRELFGDHKVTPQTYARVAGLLDTRTLVDLVNLMGMYAMTAAVLIAFDAQLPPEAPERLSETP